MSKVLRHFHRIFFLSKKHFKGNYAFNFDDRPNLHITFFHVLDETDKISYVHISPTCDTKGVISYNFE